MYRKVILSVFFIFVFSLSPACAAMIEVEGRYWITELDAKAKVQESGIGTDFDFKSDLGIDDENFPELRATLYMGENNRLRFAYTQLDYSGSNDITRTIQFEGQTYTAGIHVNSRLDITYLRLGWIWQFIDLMDNVKLGTLLEMKAILADISLEAPDSSISESENIIGGLPTIGACLDINPIEKLNLFAEISGITAGNYGHFLDFETGIKYLPFENFSIVGGYRIMDLEVEYDDNFVNAQITGPFIAGTLRF